MLSVGSFALGPLGGGSFGRWCLAREAGRLAARALLGVVEGAPWCADSLALTYGMGADPPGVGASFRRTSCTHRTERSTSMCCSPPPPPGRRMALWFSSLRLGRAGEGEEKSRLPDRQPAQTNGLRWLDRQRRTKAGRHRSLDVRDVALLFPPSRRAFEEWGNKSAGRRLGGYGREWAMDGPRSVSSRQGRLPKPTRPCPSGRRTTT